MLSLFGPVAAEKVTVVDLLGMQSGLYDFDDDETRAFCNGHPGVDVSPLDDVAFASQHGHKTQKYYPGTKQDYSSTNYELLGLILLRYQSSMRVWSWDKLDQRGNEKDN